MIKRIILVVTILAMVLSGVLVKSEKAQAAGNSTTTIASTTISGFAWFASTSHTWADFCGLATETTSSAVGWIGNSFSQATPQTRSVKFDLSTIPDGSEIIQAYIVINSASKTDTDPTVSNFYWSAYKTDWGSDETFQQADNPNYISIENGGRVTAVHTYSEVIVGNNYFEIQNLPTAFEKHGATDFIYFDITTENRGLWRYGQVWTPAGLAAGKRISFEAGTVSLYVVYAAPAEDRVPDLHTNAPVDTTVLGTEVADNITLETLRCMYADEALSFLVNGESGANVTLKLENQTGAIIDSEVDSIRTDGIYAYRIDLAADYEGFVRLRETNYSLLSDWVCVRKSPDASQQNNKIYAGITEYPQYTEPFSSYVVDDGDYMYLHYKTNVDPAAELADYSLEIMPNGDDDNIIYDQTLEWIAENYFGGTAANQAALSHWRYLVLTPSLVSGVDDYNGLVLDLGMKGHTTWRGFVDAEVRDVTDNSTIAYPHSAYWYLSDVNNGIKLAVNDWVKEDEEYTATVTIGTESHVQQNLALGAISVDGTELVTFNALVGDNILTVPAIDTVGDYTFELKLSDSSHTNYVYIYQKPLEVTTSDYAPAGDDVAAGWQDWITDFLDDKNLDNEGGHWLVILILCAIIFAFGWLTKTAAGMVAACILIILIFAGAMIMDWLNPWFIALLCLGGGLTIYGLMKHGRKSGSNEE